jgi:hypothetical protein
VRVVIKLHDTEGSEARKPRIKQKKAFKRPVIPSPDYLWCINGYNKFRNYGIKIYAAINAYLYRII